MPWTILPGLPVIHFWLAIRIAFPDMPDPFILSAERFGIALFYKELDFTKKLRFPQPNEQHGPR